MEEEKPQEVQFGKFNSTFLQMQYSYSPKLPKTAMDSKMGTTHAIAGIADAKYINSDMHLASNTAPK